ncbi:SLATT domain-containing protein [Obesumbacterium proteus]|uniref:SLATT domain-containing protein n=2 Tax=Obesumbacterium proteus TaxID=82983 RepID=UPI001F2CC741|nr:SLATT domain-containing protein [Obesumbacterium proteus]MCE9884389.1 SLATT domain-containing protein [Obesumbacterium proteus]MCE9915963.1 SLATT domain-containing protein [Obesumbacterium proteus]MCE9928194.1 SLATT domain-containing protein [Obesumbacterium proteus]
MALSDRIWWTKKSKIQTEKRLLRKDIASQIILLWYTVFSVFASVYELAKPSTNSLFSVLMVSLSVLIMAVTLFIGNRTFKERAMLVKQCYEQLSILNIQADEAEKTNNKDDIFKLEDEYKNILSVCENHSDLDYKKAVVFEYLNTESSLKAKLTKKPNFYFYFCVFLHMTFEMVISLFLLLSPIIIWNLLR